MEIMIREAKPEESDLLTQISFNSKRYWKYPEEYLEIWKKELTITKEYIYINRVYVAEGDGRVVGYYSIIYNDRDFWAGKVFVMKGYWLEHLFITPEFIKKSIGAKLIHHAKNLGKAMGCGRLFIFADPHSAGFYDRWAPGLSKIRLPVSKEERSLYTNWKFKHE